MKKAIPIGYEDLKDLIDSECYFVDKTDLIKDLIDAKTKVALFTRPRRFGKTLNMSMIKYFFECSDEDNSYLFDGLKISGYNGDYMKYQGQYPVIFITLKSMKRLSFNDSFEEFKLTVRNEFKRHIKAIDSPALLEDTKKTFMAVVNGSANDIEYTDSLRFLSDCLKTAYGKNVIVLIDEYDVPIENANRLGFYEPMIDLIRTAFEKVFKTNSNLQMGLLTGCLRVSKESIFTGLNNFEVHDIKSEDFSEHFGFTETEVKNMISYYNKDDIYDEIKKWYDGYIFGKTEIYNPFSVANAVKQALSSDKFIAKPYWSNTSSNSIVKDLITNCNEDTKDELERLTNLESIEKPIFDDLTYSDINDVNSDIIWSFLLFTGYLKQKHISDNIYSLTVPNLEVLKLYTRMLEEAFSERVKTASRDDLLKAVVSGDAENFEIILGDWLYDSVSYFDERESFYHGVVLGVLSGFPGFSLRSNREAGNGRFDIALWDKKRKTIGIILEFKYADSYDDMELKADEALNQIDEMNYVRFFNDDGVKNIIKYGIAFYRKNCKVKV